MNIVNSITSNKTECFFFSPHLDDAALSAGGLISYLSKKTKVNVITVFTECPESKPSLSGKSFLRQCGYKRAKSLFKDRRAEDISAFESVGVTVNHLGFTDALWRLKRKNNFLSKFFSNFLPEFSYVYPTYRFHVLRGKVSSFDQQTVASVKKKLKNLNKCPKNNYVVFCPAAIGGHVDHIIVRDICLSEFKNVLLWLDFPYSTGKNTKVVPLGNLISSSFVFDKNIQDKKNMVSKYKSQVKAMFGNSKINFSAEKYFVKKAESNNL